MLGQEGRSQSPSAKSGNLYERALAAQQIRPDPLNTNPFRIAAKGHPKPGDFGTDHNFLGGHVLEKKLGQGTWGACFRARSLSNGNLLSLRILSSDLSIKELAEVHVAARLVNHLESERFQRQVNLCLGPGGSILESQFVAGESLHCLVMRVGRLSLRQAIYCIARAIEGLDAAEKKGLVHGELRPSKIVVDRMGTVGIRDLALSQVTRRRRQLATDSRALLTSIPKHHLGYIAPEILSSFGNPNFSSDLYSLGCILFFLLTGDAPYKFRTPQRILWAHREAAIPRVSQRVKAIPPELDTCLERMLAKLPRDRFVSYKQCHDALREINKALPPETLSAAEQWENVLQSGGEIAVSRSNILSSNLKILIVRATLGIATVCGLAAFVWYMTSSASHTQPPSELNGVRDVPTAESEDSFIIR